MRYRRTWLYPLLLFLQTAGLGIILWQGAPVYRRILAGSEGPTAGPKTLILVMLAVGLMQGAYWLRTAIISTLRLPPNVFLNHIVLLFSRLSFIFGGALFTAVIYLRLPDLEKSIPRFVVLVAVLFSMFCYSRELEWLATELTGRHRE